MYEPWGIKKNVYLYQILRILILLLVIIVASSAYPFWKYIGYPNLGFGCIVDSVPEGNCFHSLYPKNASMPQLELFLNIHQANREGAACNHAISNTDMMNVPIALLTFSLKPNLTLLSVNAEAL